MKKTVLIICIFFVLTLGFVFAVNADGAMVDGVNLRSIRLDSYPDKTVYGAFEQLDTAGLSLVATYSDGSEKIVSGKDIRISYLRDNCFRVGDDSVILSYGGKNISLPVTVNRIPYDLSSLELVGFSTVYTGKYQSYASLIPRIVGLDGIALTVNAVGGGVNVGEYDISIDFSTESVDYLIPESRVITMTIEPARADIIWKELSFVYDGKSKSPVAYYTDVTGAKIYPTVTGAATNAGTSYTAKVTVNDPNYVFTNKSVGYEIRKADYDFSNVVWSKDSFTYDGSKKSISASGLPLGVSVIGYTGDRGTDAGIYTAVAQLSWDETNYNAPSPLTHTWEIKKADYDMSGVSFESASCVFDGEAHYPTLVGMMPTGADGIRLEYSFSAGASHVSDGVVAVIVSFSTESKNYNTPPEHHSSVTITPRGIEVIWGELNLTYNGEEQAPDAYAEECTINVEGKKTVAGKYTAIATTANTDYYIKNDKVEYFILKAENYWTEEPSDSICYEGKAISLTGSSKFGNIIYTFYTDPEATKQISEPKACGKYFARISVAETENYSGLESEIVSVEIVEIVAVSFIAVIVNKDLQAFDVLLPTDIICSVLNNDGSEEQIDSARVAIVYENGKSFRKSDKYVTLKYGGFSLSLPVEIDFADYDMSGVRWHETEQTYDGKAKYPIPTGLPEGVSVNSYLGNEMVNAGEYKVYVSLSYDSENYNEPILPPCDFLIKKQPVNTPLITVVYNGKEHIPTTDSHLYTITGEGEYISAGMYTVNASLNDPQNYVFKESGAENVNALFEILPATLMVSVSDVKLMLFEKLSGAEYELTDGTVYGDDVVNFIPYAEGNKVLLRSDNPNYILDVTHGKIIRLPYPTFEGLMFIIAAMIGVLVIALVVLKFYRHRDAFATAGAVIKCRWHNRGFKASLPKQEEPKDEHPFGGFSFDLKSQREENSEETEEQAFDNEENSKEEPSQEDIGDRIEFEIDADKADSLITDSLARSLIKRDGEIIYSEGNRKAVMSIEDIGRVFSAGQRVDINKLKEKKLVPSDTAYLKVLGGGKLDKPLSVYANEFSLCAVKMIALTGGQAIKIVTLREKSREEKE